MSSVDLESFIIDIPDYPEPGVIFKDITPLIGSPQGLAASIDEIADHFMGKGITAVVGSEARGFLVGTPVAYRLGVGLYGRLSSKRYYQVDGDGKGYQTWRLTTTHDLGRSRLFDYRLEAGIDNILNYCDRTPHGLHLGTTTPGRTVYATLTVRLKKGKRIKFNNTKFNSNKQQQNEED